MDAVASKAPPAVRSSYNVIFAVSAAHLINDLIQFLLPALYPLLKVSYELDYFQIGLLPLAIVFSLTQTPFIMKHLKAPEPVTPEPPDPGF